MPRRKKAKCSHEYKEIWVDEYKRCVKCGLAYWYWQCEDRWRRAVPFEVLKRGVSLSLSKLSFDAETRETMRLKTKCFRVWNAEKKAYELVTYLEYLKGQRFADGQYTRFRKSLDYSGYDHGAQHVD